MSWLWGRKKKNDEVSGDASGSGASSEVLMESPPPPTFETESATPTVEGAQFQSPGDLLATAPLSSSSTSAGALRGYNPYQGLPSTLDAGTLSSIYNLPDEPEHLFSEEASRTRRVAHESIQYVTGAGWLGGMFAGGAYGAFTGLKSSPGLSVESRKLLANRVLNAANNRGNLYGNNLGVLGLFFACSESLLGHYRGTDDILNDTVAGAAAGMLFKSTSGPRAMLVYGSLSAVAFTVIGGAHRVLRM